MMKVDEEASLALARIDALHTALTHLVLEGGDLDQIAAEAADVLGIEVVFTSTDGRERASAISQEGREALAVSRLVDATGRVRVERVKDDGLLLEVGEVRSLRVAAGGTDLARLVCLRLDRPITEVDVHALERVAIVAALLITRQSAVSAVENKYQGDFMRDLLVRGVGEESYVEEHVSAFGWTLGHPVVVVVAEIDPQPREEKPASREQRRTWQERFSAAWRQVSQALDPGIPSVDFSSEVVTLLPVTVERVTETWPGHDVVRRVVTGVAGDKGGGRRSFTVGVSRVAPDVAALPEAYAQARRAVEIGRRVRGTGSTTFFDELGLHRLIALIPDAEELRAFTRDVLGPLTEQTTDAANLRETLQVLLDTNFNVAEAARLQFFHYNTMRYRVSKLERLLGPLSSDPHLRLDVAVALRVLEIAG
ncbi:helix-turn-helix domain-containing protein [Nocardioides agariphilus]|jgi:purine catabolism regulator|uniref:Helix-turn-helix domain-containing protein n=1 Tax=Nocardioides agariphilus TaxID=433664 RepID=A0A930VKL9_9ACTN|nr:helix-turn-helix domain-containing protein [Nocardioides agariphilus]MBF4766356.1 helix-turn-helix domain-containing protein [Nocardioides agariphilus]